VCSTLDLFGLEGQLDIRTLEVLLPHERQHKLAVVLARESAEHGHDGELVVQHGDGEGVQAQLLNAGKTLGDAAGNALERLVRLLDNEEEDVVRTKAHAGDLLAVDLKQLASHGSGILLAGADKRALGWREMGKVVASSLLLSEEVALAGPSVVQLDASVDRLLLSGERNDLAVGILGGNNEVKLGLFPGLVNDAPEAQLAKPGGHGQAPGHSTVLVELANGGGADRHGGQAC
jgi:hypothetical protein